MLKATGRATLALLALVSLLVVVAPAGAVVEENASTTVFHVPLAGPDPEGAGVAVLRFNRQTGELCYVIVVRGIGEPTEPAPGIGSAHIHSATGIAVDLETEFMHAGESDVFVATDCVEVDEATMEAILANPSAFYVNVHTAEFPGGAIEGRLV